MQSKKMIPIAEPLLNGNELQYVSDCIKSGWISSAGKYVEEFERQFARYIGCKYGVAVHNGTVALHLALVALGIGRGDEVIIPTLTFAATANAVLYTGAKPVLVDVERDTWNIDPEQIEAKISERTRAIIPVHLYGHPCDLDRILNIASNHDIVVIEDAAEAHGAQYKGTKVGGAGMVGCFSFYGNKIITTGEGGMCLCNDEHMAERMTKLRDHGMMKDKRYWHDEVGFNYRMTNLQAAVGVAQLERIDDFLARKRKNAELYESYLSDLSTVVLPEEKPWARSSYWMYSIRLKGNPRSGLMRDDLIHSLRKEGIESRPVFYPLHQMPPYRQEESYPVAEEISASGLSLPSSVTLTKGELEFVCRALKKHLGTLSSNT